MNLQNLLSKVQRSLGDESFNKIKRAEIMDLLDDAMYTVAATVRLWIEQLEITPRKLTEDFTVNDVSDLTALNAQEGDTAYVLTAGQRYRFYNSAWEEYAYNIIRIDPEITQIYQTIQVWKNGVQCTERSLQAINQGYGTGYLFTGTNAVAPNSLGIEYAQYRRPNDGSDFVFARDFESTDVVTIIYRNERPINAKLWVTQVEVPYPVLSAIQYLLTSMCLTVLYMRGDDTALARSEYANQLAQKELAAANAYLRNLLNENSSINVQPLRWLPE